MRKGERREFKVASLSHAKRFRFVLNEAVSTRSMLLTMASAAFPAWLAVAERRDTLQPQGISVARRNCCLGLDKFGSTNEVSGGLLLGRYHTVCHVQSLLTLNRSVASIR